MVICLFMLFQCVPFVIWTRNIYPNSASLSYYLALWLCFLHSVHSIPLPLLWSWYVFWSQGKSLSHVLIETWFSVFGINRCWRTMHCLMWLDFFFQISTTLVSLPGWKNNVTSFEYLSFSWEPSEFVKTTIIWKPSMHRWNSRWLGNPETFLVSVELGLLWCEK